MISTKVLFIVGMIEILIAIASGIYILNQPPNIFTAIGFIVFCVLTAVANLQMEKHSKR